MDVETEPRRLSTVGNTSNHFPASHPSSSSSTKRQNRTSQGQPPVPSFAAFKAKTSSVPGQVPVRRKPVPANLSISSSRTPSVDVSTRRGSQHREGARNSASFDGIQQPPVERSRQSSGVWPDSVLEGLSIYPSDITKPPPAQADARVEREDHRTSTAGDAQPCDTSSRPRYDRGASSYHTAQTVVSDPDDDLLAYHTSEDTKQAVATAPRGPLTPHEADSQLSAPGRDYFHQKKASTATVSTTTQARSPVQKFTSLFGWKSSSKTHESESPSTIFTDRSPSPSISSSSSKYTADNMPHALQPSPQAIDTHKANSSAHIYHYAGQPTPPTSRPSAASTHAEELERELREVSVELANSVRREMELEDEVERFKSEHTGTAEVGRRTSDYYSDSGASSVRHPQSDSDSKIEALERLRRKAEQEKAQLKVEMAERINDGLTRQRKLESRVESLEMQLKSQQSEVTSSQADHRDVRQLEATIEDVRRRLTEEKQFKENFEDLLAALQQDLEQHRNERDNLRDEVVPQLRARVEGLEAEAATMQNLAYENARMQQELQSLKAQNQALLTEKSNQSELQRQQPSGFSSIAEDAAAPQAEKLPRAGLSRSNSLARGSVRGVRASSLSRSNSVRDRPEPREAFSDRLQDIEEQRDALHRALRSLLQRQELQVREHQKRVRMLEQERDQLAASTPRRAAFHQEVANLRSEVNHLRRRADDALEQKWQCEKGLGGLKMDLDRAQLETTSLRELLQEHDIFVPDRSSSTSDDVKQEGAAQMSLDRALQELRATHALSLAQVQQQLDGNEGLTGDRADAEDALALLKQSITDAESERDVAQREAESYREQARTLQQSELAHLSKEKQLAAQLHSSAARMDELAAQVKQQLQSNKNLRARLAEAIARGEREQKSSAARIVEMQSKLRTLEDKVMAAQLHSEQVVHNQETEVQQLKESNNPQLRRSRSGLLSPAKLVPSSPKSPLFMARSPRLNRTTSGLGLSMAEASRTEVLQSKVKDLERALSDADNEMQEVVSRMNMAQMEVAELQFER